jgi:hypothetical protein
MEITVTQHYNWQYLRSVWNWDLPIELSMYAEYLEKVRPTDVTYWVNMAKDPGDDSHISSMVRGLNSLANQESLTEVQKLYFVITFVQSMTYTVDSVTTPYDEYPRYPIQTLFDRGGDCEDTSILVAALLDRMGYDVALIHLPGHMAVGVAISNSYGSYYEYEKKKYSYLETTGEGFEIGEVPLGFTDLPVLGIYPLRG